MAARKLGREKWPIYIPCGFAGGYSLFGVGKRFGSKWAVWAVGTGLAGQQRVAAGEPWGNPGQAAPQW